ncbi:MAG: class I SAM-dependent methyltransferase [Spirochaetales bacterium]|nr:class I SAM-dependent methyltransferase [Spirochaetales bacterium]
MKKSIIKEIDKDSFRKNLIRFTWQAYNTIPQIKAPAILDIGCGSGNPTIELAVLSKGMITAVDIDGGALNTLNEKINALRLSGHIKTIRRSLFKLGFKTESFDIIWAEGSIAVIGFEKGLSEWHKYLKPGGYLVVHDEIKNHEQKINRIPGLHYTLLDHFIIPERVWLDEYFSPLEKRIESLKIKYKKDAKIMNFLEGEAAEIEQFNKSPKSFASIFYIMQKA